MTQLSKTNPMAVAVLRERAGWNNGVTMNPVHSQYLYACAKPGVSPNAPPAMFWQKTHSDAPIQCEIHSYKVDAAVGGVSKTIDPVFPQEMSWSRHDLPKDMTDNTGDLASFASTFGGPDIPPTMNPSLTRPMTGQNLDHESMTHNEYNSKIIGNILFTDQSWQLNLFAPPVIFNGLTKFMMTMIFERTIARRLPFEVPPHLTSWTRKTQIGSVLRYGIGHETELTLLRTAYGRKFFTGQKVQVAEAAIALMNLQANVALMVSQKGKTTRAEAEHQTYTIDKFNEIIEKEVLLWDAAK